MDLVLNIHTDAYELWRGDALLARLQGGASALLRGADEHLRELDIEAAIEHAEDWLMPFSQSLTGLELQVRGDGAPALAQFLGRETLSGDDIERAFSAVVTAIARAQAPDRTSTAHIVLLRELVHHGRLRSIRV